jgi:hypothetical protein
VTAASDSCLSRSISVVAGPLQARPILIPRVESIVNLILTAAQIPETAPVRPTASHGHGVSRPPLKLPSGSAQDQAAARLGACQLVSAS